MTIGTDMAKMLAEVVDRDIRIMHVCGTHEAAIAKYGIRSVLPPQLKIVMGPGCPVCITPQGEIDAACELAERGCIVTTYGDLRACIRGCADCAGSGKGSGDCQAESG